MPAAVPAEAPEFVQDGHRRDHRRRRRLLPVSALPVDGTFPTGTTQWEKRNIALEIPVWEPDVCIQCGKCVHVSARTPPSAPRSIDRGALDECAGDVQARPTPMAQGVRRA